MASEDVQTNLRMPADLKDRLMASAAENNRSLSAEVALRLEKSFHGDGSGLKREIEMQVAVALARVDSLSLRAELIRSRMDNLQVRLHLVSSETERLAKAAQNDEDFAKAESRMKEYDTLEAESALLESQLKELLAERDEASARLGSLHAALLAYGEKLESALATRPKPKP